MSSPRETFNFGAAPYFAPSGRRDLLPGADMINFGSAVPPPGSGQSAHRPPYGRAFRKRCSSPLASGPARKRRADEESMIGDLQNLSLNSMRERQQKSRFQRWQELEARLADQLASEEQQLGRQQRQSHCLLSDELQKIVSSPAPNLIPDTKIGPCTALVLWQPPPVYLLDGDSAKKPAAPPPADPCPAPPPPPPAAYDFSAFRRPGGGQQPAAFPFSAGGSSALSPSAAGWPHQAPARYQFGAAGWPGPGTTGYQSAAAPAPTAAAAGTAPPIFARCLGVPLPADDESMEL